MLRKGYRHQAGLGPHTRQKNTTMKKNDIVEIFELWRTKERSEGQARLVKLIRTEDDYEYWTVKFIADGFKCDRFILNETV